MGQAKRARSTPATRPHLCKFADGTIRSRRAALTSILALSTAAGAAAIVVGSELLPKPAAAGPDDPDTHIQAFVARHLPAFVVCQGLANRMNEKRRLAYAEVGLEPNWRDEGLMREGELPALAEAFTRHSYFAAQSAWREAEDAVTMIADELAAMRPVTLSGFIAKARLAKYQPYIAIHIMHDLLAFDV